jgi:SfnB family sulfur acquisition oxidoreductase
MTQLISPPAKIIKTDQEAVNQAYQVADFALEGRRQRDQQRQLPYAEVAQFSQRGLGGVRIPRAYGGAFIANKTLAQIFRIIAKSDANLGQIPQNQFGLLNIIDVLGSAAQKKFIYAQILQGKRLANGGPERYSKDTKTVNTRLSIAAGRYEISGEKFYSTGSAFADWIAVRAWHPEGYVVLVLIDRHAAGLQILDDWDGFGQRLTSSGSVRLDKVEVDPFLIFDERALTERPTYRGAYSQLLQVAIDVGIAEAAFSDTLSAIYKARPVVDSQLKKASQEPFVLQEVGKLNILLDAAILLLDEAADYLDQLDALVEVSPQQAAQASILVAQAKIYANDAALGISEKLFELGGSRASLQHYNFDQHWRNARVHTLHDPLRWKFHILGNYYLNQQLPQQHAWV